MEKMYQYLEAQRDTYMVCADMKFIDKYENVNLNKVEEIHKLFGLVRKLLILQKMEVSQ